jgi:hypothetical protein
MASGTSTFALFGKKKLECGTFFTTDLRSPLANQEKKYKEESI